MIPNNGKKTQIDCCETILENSVMIDYTRRIPSFSTLGKNREKILQTAPKRKINDSLIGDIEKNISQPAKYVFFECRESLSVN